MTPRAGAAALRKISIDVEVKGRQAVNDVAGMTYALAVAMSSGDVPTAVLSARPPGLNHPYGLGPSNARGPRGPIPFGDPAMINEQTGDFASHWGIDRTTSDGASEGARVFNDSPHADFLENGTETSRPRPIKEAVEKQVSEHAEDVARKALRTFL